MISGRHFEWLLISTVLGSALLTTARAQEQPESDQVAAPLRYRRIYVPNTELDLFTRGYLPLERDEFRRLLESVDDDSTSFDEPTTWLKAAEYSAVFVDDQLAGGNASFSVHSTTEAPSRLPLWPCQIALGTATWQKATRSQEAIIGNDADGKLVALTSGSGTLSIPWTLRGSRNEWGEVVFDFVLPPAPLNRLTIELPAALQLLSNRGVVSLVTAESGVKKQAADASRQWQVELGGVHQFQLTVASLESIRQRHEPVSIQLDTTYRLAEDGLQVDCTAILDIRREGLDTLLFRVDPGLQVTNVRMGSRDLSWSMVNDAHPDSVQLLIRFPEPLVGIRRRIDLTAIAPLTPGTVRQLPRLQAEQTLWRQGTMTLIVPEQLELRHLRAEHARQSSTSPVDAVGSAISRRFELFSQQATLEINAVRRQTPPTAVIGTTIDLETGSLTATVNADLSCSAGEHYQLVAEIPNSWMLDGIETEPSGALQDHHYIGYEGHRKQLQIRLSEALSPDHPVRLLIRAHRTPTFELHADDFRPVRFQGLTDTDRLVAIAPDASFRLDVHGDAGVDRRDPASLDPKHADLVTPRSGGILFRDNQLANLMTVKVTREDPIFSVKTEVEVDVDGDTLAESYRLKCTPESASVSRIIVVLTQPRSEPIDWQLAGVPNQGVRAKRLADMQTRPNRYRQKGEVWELLLGRPQSDTFEILGSRHTSRRRATSISLAIVLDATSQEGWLTISSKDGAPLSIKATAAKPIPTLPPLPPQCALPQARYRYDVSRNPQVLLDQVEDGSRHTPLWAWQCLLRSQIDSLGTVRHNATYLLESSGRSQFQFRLPVECTLAYVQVGETHVARPLFNEMTNAYTVTLPPDKRFPRVTIAYTTATASWRIWRQVTSRLPVVDIPVLDRRWIMWSAPNLTPIASTSPSSLHHYVTWAQRFLGPLAASPDQPPFNLFSRSDWQALVQTHDSWERSNDSAAGFLQVIGEEYLSLKGANGSLPISWHTIWQRYLDRSLQTPSLPRVWVDAGFFADLGFAVKTPISDPGLEDPREIATELLRNARLTTMASHHVLLITGLDNLAPSDAATLNETLEEQNWDDASWISEAMAMGSQQAQPDGAEPRIVPLSEWVGPSNVTAQWWPARREPLQRSIAGRNWQAYVAALPGEGKCEESVTVTHNGLIDATAWAAFFLGSGLLGWCGGFRPQILLPAILASAVVTMLIPAPWVPITSSLFLGSLLGAAIVAARRQLLGRQDDPDVESDASVSAKLAPTIGACLLLCLIATNDNQLAAQEPLASQTGSQTDSAPYRVLVPVDGDLKPVGDYDYVPAELYDRLHSRSLEDPSARQNWIVHRADYHAVFNWTRRHSFLDLTSLTAVYQLHVLGPLARLEFPWPGTDPNSQILEAKLSGSPVELTWNRTRTAFSVPISGQGVKHLELVLLPTMADQSGMRLLRFSVPPLAQAQLRIQTPFDAPAIDMVSRGGEAHIVAEAGERLVELGPVPALEMKWPWGELSQNRPRQIDIQQMIWIKVRPKDHADSVIVETLLRAQLTERSNEEIALRVDPRLRRLPLAEQPGIEIDDQDFQNGLQDTILLRFSGTSSQYATARLQFVMANVTGLGNVSLPSLEVENCRLDRQWLAVSVASDLDYVATESEALSELDMAEFLAVWGQAESAPDLCYRINASDPTWSISTRARSTRPQTRQLLDVSVGHATMKLVFNADIHAVGEPVFQHTLSVPPGLVLQQTTLTSAGETVAVTANHDHSDALTLFFEQGITGEHHVEMQGELAVPQFDTDIPVPRITLQETIVTSSLVRLYRQINVLVSINNAVRNEFGTRTGTGRFRSDYGRFLGEIDATLGGAEAPQITTMRVRPNRPFLRTRLVTTLQRSDGVWEAIADLEAEVTNAPAGVVDQFRLEIPNEWKEPFLIEPAMPYDVTPISSQRRHLVLRPRFPIPNQFRLRVRGALLMGDEERGRTPDIVPLDSTHTDSFFVLPTQLDQQRIDWETSGLRNVPLTDVLPESRTDTRGQVAFAVFSKPRAVIADVQRVAGSRQIDLADVQLTYHADGSSFGSVTFNIEPAGSDSCTLELPAGGELVQVTVEGVPAMLIPLADGRWHVQLTSEQLPQQLVILFCSDPPKAAQSPAQAIRIPWITDVQIVHTLWTVYMPRGMHLTGDDLARHRVTSIQQDAIRLQTSTALVESAVETVLDSPAADIQAWYLPWAARLAALADRLECQQATARALQTISGEALRAIRSRQQTVAERLNSSLAWNETIANARSNLNSPHIVPALSSADMLVNRLSFTEPPPSIGVFSSRVTAPESQKRALASLGILLLGIGCSLAFRSSHFADWLQQWPSVIGVPLGMLWWLFATPSLFGWLIIALSVGYAVRLHFTSQPVRDTTSEASRELTE